MKLTEHIKSISHLKAHTFETFSRLADKQETMVIIHNGEDKRIIQEIEQTQQTMALLKIMALGNQQISQGDVQSAASVFERLRTQLGRQPCHSI
jgi:hypothetical protein